MEECGIHTFVKNSSRAILFIRNYILDHGSILLVHLGILSPMKSRLNGEIHMRE